MAEGTNRVRELGPLKSVGGTWVGRWWDGGGKVGRCSRFSCQERGGSLSSAIPSESLPHSPLCRSPIQSLQMALGVMAFDGEALPEPTIGAPFPGVWGTEHGYSK